MALPSPPASSETLQDVYSSSAMQDVRRQTERSRGRRSSGKMGDDQSPFTIGMDPQHKNFRELWLSGRGPNLLFDWIGAYLPNYKLQVVDVTRGYEEIHAVSRLTAGNRKRVTLEIRLPHPNYELMVRHRTMRQFNQYEPPALKVVAEEELELGGVPAMYYRTEKGKCSLLFKVARDGIVNLSVDRCDNSEMMMDIAKSLDFKRLNAKLLS